MGSVPAPISKENLAFSKMGAICELEELHKSTWVRGTRIGMVVLNLQSIHTAARDLRQTLADTLQKRKFFSIQVDGSTDAANVEEELFLVLHFNPYTEDGKVNVHSNLLCVSAL